MTPIRKQQHTVLANGVTVVTDHAPHFQSIAIGLAVKVGSVNETEVEAGISHILEHLVFRGTKTRTGDELQRAFAASGGYLNAMTDEDHTIFQGLTLAADIENAIEILAEMVADPLLSAEDLELEKQIVQQESCRGCFNCTLRDTMFDQAFPDGPLKQPIIGYEDTVNNLSRDDVVSFHDRTYVGSNITLVVSGDVDHAGLVGLAERTLGTLSSGQATRIPPLDYVAGEVHIGHGGDQAALRITFPLTSFDRPTFRAACLFSDMLGGRGQSRLMTELREKRGLVYSAWSDIYSVAGQHLLMVEASGEARRMPEITTVMIDTIRDLAQSPNSEDFELIKSQMNANFHMNLDNLTGRVTDTVSDVFEFGKPQDYAERQAAYAAIELADLREVGQSILMLEPTFVSTGPARGKPKFAELRARLAGNNGMQH